MHGRHFAPRPKRRAQCVRRAPLTTTRVRLPWGTARLRALEVGHWLGWPTATRYVASPCQCRVPVPRRHTGPVPDIPVGVVAEELPCMPRNRRTPCDTPHMTRVVRHGPNSCDKNWRGAIPTALQTRMRARARFEPLGKCTRRPGTRCPCPVYCKTQTKAKTMCWSLWVRIREGESE
jgi:hypothetical protein